MRIVHKNTKTITESDNNLFCLLTMNPHPVHLNVVYAKSTQRKPVMGRYLLWELSFSLSL